MTKDRIEQLRAGNSVKNSKKRKGSQQIEDNEETEENEMTALTIQPSDHVIVTVNTPDKSELVPVYQYVNKINQYIAQIQEDIVQLKRYHVRLQQSTRPDSSLREQVDSLDENIKTTAMQIKTSLKELKNEKKGDEERVFNRVVKTQHSLLTKRFREAMWDYEQSLSAHKKICEDIIKKQLHIVIEWLQIRKMTCVPAEREVTDEELNEMLESKDPAIFVDNEKKPNNSKAQEKYVSSNGPAVFLGENEEIHLHYHKSQILEVPPYTQETLEARQSLDIVRDRHKEILNIEKSIEQIRALHLDIALYVTQQGELIDRIEYHIGDGYVKTYKGHKKLHKAQKLMIKARKKKMWIIIFLTSVIGICLLILFI